MLMQPVPQLAGSQTTRPDKVRPIFLESTNIAAGALARTAIRKAPGNQPQVALGNGSSAAGTAERLFVALADAKVWTSRVAMHLDRDTRDRLFRQLDVLHDAEGWEGDDKPVALQSYQSLVRAVLYHRINCRPALSLMPNGNVLALWQDGADRLTVEFLPGNRARWFVQSVFSDGPERATGTVSLERLRAVIEPYGAARWFDGS